MPLKDKIEKFKDGAKYQEISAHVDKYKYVYIAGATGAAFGALAVLLLRGHSAPTQIFNTNNVTPVFNNTSIVNNAGHMTKIVKRLSDGKMWETVTEAAAEEGVPLSMMSRHLNGHLPNVYGQHYTIAGLSTTG
jgi:hypothetical protein